MAFFSAPISSPPARPIRAVTPSRTATVRSNEHRVFQLCYRTEAAPWMRLTNGRNKLLPLFSSGTTMKALLLYHLYFFLYLLLYLILLPGFSVVVAVAKERGPTTHLLCSPKAYRIALNTAQPNSLFSGADLFHDLPQMLFCVDFPPWSISSRVTGMSPPRRQVAPSICQSAKSDFYFLSNEDTSRPRNTHCQRRCPETPHPLRMPFYHLVLRVMRRKGPISHVVAQIKNRLATCRTSLWPGQTPCKLLDR